MCSSDLIDAGGAADNAVGGRVLAQVVLRAPAALAVLPVALPVLLPAALLAVAQQADGILAFGIAPGFADTEMATESLDAEGMARAVAEIPLGALAPPDEIGALAAFLCSDATRHLTGSTFDVNGASHVR